MEENKNKNNTDWNNEDEAISFLESCGFTVDKEFNLVSRFPTETELKAIKYLIHEHKYVWTH